MAHNINEENGKQAVFTVGTPAWHGLGQVLENPATAEEAIQKAHLDWEVEKRELYYNFGPGTDSIRAEDKFATVRQDTQNFLGVVGKNYKVLQNREAFNFFDNIVEKDEAIFETAGALGKGEVIWMAAKMPAYIKVGKDDLIDQYVLLTNTHNGTGSVTALITPIRVVCNNTLTAALRGSTNKVSIRHTQNMEERLKQAKELLGIVERYKLEMEPVFNRMAGVKVKNQKMMDDFFHTMYPVNREKFPEKEFELSEKVRVQISEAFEQGAGADMPTANGTVFGLYNAVTYFTDHMRNYKTQDSRLSAVTWGDSASMRKRAFSAALSMI